MNKHTQSKFDILSKQKASKELVEFITVIAEPSRFRIVQVLFNTSYKSINQFREILFISQPVVLQYLKILKMVSFVVLHRNGQQILYSLDHIGIREKCGSGIDYLGDYLNNICK